MPPEDPEHKPHGSTNDRETKTNALRIISIGCLVFIALFALMLFALYRFMVALIMMPPDLPESELSDSKHVTITGFDYSRDSNVVASLGVQSSYGFINYGLYKTDTKISNRSRLAKGTFEELHVSATGRYAAAQAIEMLDPEDAPIYIYDLKRKKRIAKLKVAGGMYGDFLWYPKTDTLIFDSGRGLSVYRPKSGKPTLLIKESSRKSPRMRPLFVSEAKNMVIFAVKKSSAGEIMLFDIDKSTSRKLVSVKSVLPTAGTLVKDDFYFLQETIGAYRLSKVNLSTRKIKSVDKSAKSLGKDNFYFSNIRNLVYAKKHNSLLYSYPFGNLDDGPEESNSERVIMLDLKAKKKRLLFSAIIGWDYSEKEDLFIWVNSMDSEKLEESTLSKLLQGDDLNP